MNRLKINAFMVAAVLGMALVPQIGGAADPADFRTGTFDGNWCGSTATFTITKKLGDTWKFEGTVKIHSTRQVDTLTVEQLKNNSLHMVRFLSGKHSGETQVMVTHPPETKSSGNSLVVNFPTRRTYGYGARLAGFVRMPVVQ